MQPRTLAHVLMAFVVCATVHAAKDGGLQCRKVYKSVVEDGEAKRDQLIRTLEGPIREVEAVLEELQLQQKKITANNVLHGPIMRQMLESHIEDLEKICGKRSDNPQPKMDIPKCRRTLRKAKAYEKRIETEAVHSVASTGKQYVKQIAQYTLQIQKAYAQKQASLLEFDNTQQQLQDMWKEAVETGILRLDGEIIGACTSECATRRKELQNRVEKLTLLSSQIHMKLSQDNYKEAFAVYASHPEQLSALQKSLHEEIMVLQAQYDKLAEPRASHERFLLQFCSKAS